MKHVVHRRVSFENCSIHSTRGIRITELLVLNCRQKWSTTNQARLPAPRAGGGKVRIEGTLLTLLH